MRFPLQLRGQRNSTVEVDAALAQVGLAGLAKQSARTLSGGEAQRVALAWAMVIRPEVLLLDEATANLDPYNVSLIEQTVRSLNAEQDVTVVLVTHNVYQARGLANRIVLMLDGKVKCADVQAFFEFSQGPTYERVRARGNGLLKLEEISYSPDNLCFGPAHSCSSYPWWPGAQRPPRRRPRPPHRRRPQPLSPPRPRSRQRQPHLSPPRLPEPAATAVPEPTPVTEPVSQTFRLATTTSTADSGLLDFILPEFEQTTPRSKWLPSAPARPWRSEQGRCRCRTRPQPQRRGPVRGRPERQGAVRRDVQRLIIVGPKDDPAKIAGMASAKDAFKAIAEAKSPFVSRGDKCGTNTKELSIWASPDHTDEGVGLVQCDRPGHGRNAAFRQREERLHPDRPRHLPCHAGQAARSRVLSAATTWPRTRTRPAQPLRRAGRQPDKHPGVNAELAAKFVEWILSPEVQQMIGAFGVASSASRCSIRTQRSRTREGEYHNELGTTNAEAEGEGKMGDL